MQKIIDAEKSDLFDVLAHVAFAMQPISREEWASVAHREVHERFSDKQQAFLDFVHPQPVTGFQRYLYQGAWRQPDLEFRRCTSDFSLYPISFSRLKARMAGRSAQ